MQQLREYETDWLRRIKRSRAKRVAIVGPTGSGKTVVAAHLVARAAKSGQRVLFIAHRRELIEQAMTQIRSAGVSPHNIGAIVSSTERFLPANPAAKVQIASIQALFWRDVEDLPPADLIVIDEAHHTPAESYRDILRHYPSAAVYGLTATPYRFDGKGLGSLFDDLVQSTPPSELVEAGWLQRPTIYTVPASQRPRLLGMRVRGGDYDVGALARASDLPQLIGSIVSHYQRLAEGRPTVVYAVNVRHAEHITKQFLDRNIPACVLHGGTPAADRDRILTAFENGKLPVIVNCLILTEGWDCPTARCGIIARPTRSTSLWAQMAGRFTRPGRVPPIILDHAGNALMHGMPLEDVTYSLEGKQVDRKSWRDIREKKCPTCGSATGVMIRKCNWCGYEWWEWGALPDVGRGQLVRVDPRFMKMCVYDKCPTPQVPVQCVDENESTPLHRDCKSLRKKEHARFCTFEGCPKPQEQLQDTNRSTMHLSCRLKMNDRVTKAKVACVYTHCIRPGETFYSRSTMPIHAECQKLKTLSLRKCVYDKCATPDVLLGAKAHCNEGHRMHRACASRARSERVNPLADRCRVCGAVRTKVINGYCPAHLPTKRRNKS